MKRLVSALALSLLTLNAVRPLSCAQDVSVIPLVPAANWRLISTQGLGLDEIKSYGGDPAIEHEYGVNSLEVRTYQLDGTRAEVVLESAADVSAAYGLLTYYQNESMHPEKGIQLAMTGPQVSLMARGRSFIRFLRPKNSQISENDFRALMILVGGTRPTSRRAYGAGSHLTRCGREAAPWPNQETHQVADTRAKARDHGHARTP